MADITLNAVCMASGFSVRFEGQNKLLTPFLEKPLVSYALSLLQLPLFHQSVVVYHHPAIAQLAKTQNISTVFNKHPHYGQSHSMKLGLSQLPPANGTLFLPGDMPLLSADMLQCMYTLFSQNPQHIIAASAGGIRKSPVIFPSAFYPALLQLTGDEGGRQVIKEHLHQLLLCEAPSPYELTDVDSVQNLQHLEKIAQTK